MEDYTASADKLRHELQHLDRILEGDDLSLAISVAKRCRRECNNLVRALARERDTLQPGGHKQ